MPRFSYWLRPAPIAVLTLLAFVLAGGLAAPPAFAKKKKDEPAATPEKDKKGDEDSPYKDWDKTLKDAETLTGLFTMHRKYDNVWIEVKPDQLDKDFLMVSTLGTGLGKGFILGGMPLDTDLWYFHRAGNRVQIRIKNARFRAAQGSPMSKAVALSYSDSVLTTAKIVSVQKDSNSLLLDINEVLISDLPGVGLALKQFLGSPASFDKDRSAISKIKVFPSNVEIEIAAVYSSPEAKPLDTVSDPRYLPIALHYSLSDLPVEGYQARLADDRVGYFVTAVKNFSQDSADSFFVRYVNRWKLEKQDPSASLSPPKEPIVYYIDKTIPDEYRGYVREGLLMWNKAFEKAGFKDAIVVKDPPDDPDFDPEDVRYNTVRWITSSEPSFGAIGPSRVDPRNGHILDADILVEAAMVQNVRKGYRNYVNTLAPSASNSSEASGVPAVIAALRSMTGESAASLCSFADGVELGAAVDAAAFQAMGEMEPGGPVPEEYIRQFLHWVVAHEVGHTLGLRHNFRASAATPNNRLNDVAWTHEHGLYDSVMEYPSPNISMNRQDQGDYYTQTVGDYDLWAIQYGYTPFSADTPQAEVPELNKIAMLSMQPGHEYGTDDDALAGPIPVGVDPDVNQFDLGADPVAYAKQRLALIQAVRGKIQSALVAPGEGYERLRNTFDSLATAQGQVLQIVSKQIGGLSTSRSHKGDPGQRPAFVPLPAARQRDAMNILATSAFADSAWAVTPELLNSLEPSHWMHWGVDFAKMVPLDYPYSDRVVDIQTEILERMTHPILLSRVHEAESRSRKGEAYTLAEHLRSLTDATFSELTPKGVAPASGFAISSMRRSLGRSMLDRLIILTNYPQPGTPEDARSLGRANLTGLDKKMSAALTNRAAGMDEATKAYLEESRARIRRALAAQSIVLG